MNEMFWYFLAIVIIPMLQESLKVLDTLTGNCKLENSPSSGTRMIVKSWTRSTGNKAFVHIPVLVYQFWRDGGKESLEEFGHLSPLHRRAIYLFIQLFNCWPGFFKLSLDNRHEAQGDPEAQSLKVDFCSFLAYVDIMETFYLKIAWSLFHGLLKMQTGEQGWRHHFHFVAIAKKRPLFELWILVKLPLTFGDCHF